MKIEIRNVSYIYNKGLAGETCALKEISLTIDEPGFIAVIGSTGSGKSTLVQMLNGILRPTEGSILFDGQELAPDKEAGGKRRGNSEEQYNRKKLLKELRRKVGLVFQYPEYQLFDETVLADAAFGPKNLGASAEEAKEKARKALLSVGIGEELFEKSPFELSGGEMRRAAIAGVLAMEPEVLVLDEPTAGLDPMGKQEILDSIRSLQRQSRMNVIFVSHNMEEVAAYADRVIALDHGRIILDGTAKEVFKEHKRLEEIGLGAPEVTYLCEELGIFGVTTTEEAAERLAAKYINV